SACTCQLTSQKLHRHRRSQHAINQSVACSLLKNTIVHDLHESSSDIKLPSINVMAVALIKDAESAIKRHCSFIDQVSCENLNAARLDQAGSAIQECAIVGDV